MTNHNGGAIHYKASDKYLFSRCGKDEWDVFTEQDQAKVTCGNCLRMIGQAK